MPKQFFKLEATFINPVLGTWSGNSELTKEFILSKHPDAVKQKKDHPDEAAQLQEDELGAISEDQIIQKAATIFPKEDGFPFLWDYQLKGFFKNAALAMIMSDQFTQDELKKLRLTQYMHKRTIDLMVFPSPRKIFFELPKGGKITFHQRPLRGDTAQGERISLAISEQLPTGTKFQATIMTMNSKIATLIPEWLKYGQFNGLLQWRNSGMGAFTFKEIPIGKADML
jgi:hypothetical protein